eukprot:g2290.t2
MLEILKKYTDEMFTKSAPFVKKESSSLFKVKFMNGVHGSAFIEFSPDAPGPVEMVLKTMKQVYETGENTFKTCIKMLPATHCCFMDTSQLKTLADTMIPMYFSDDATAPCFEFAVHAEKHCASNPEIHTMDVIKIFANRVNPRHRVNLTHPARVILVSIIKNLCCVAIVDGVDYELYGKFNVRQCFARHFDKEEAGKGEAPEAGVKKVSSEGEMRVGVEAL